MDISFLYNAIEVSLVVCLRSIQDISLKNHYFTKIKEKKNSCASMQQSFSICSAIGHTNDTKKRRNQQFLKKHHEKTKNPHHSHLSSKNPQPNDMHPQTQSV